MFKKRKQLIGKCIHELIKNEKFDSVEDVTTTGNSVLKACKIVEDNGGKISLIITNS